LRVDECAADDAARTSMFYGRDRGGENAAIDALATGRVGSGRERPERLTA